jgi:hypothetical protein
MVQTGFAGHGEAFRGYCVMRMLALFSISALGGSLILNAAGTSMADDADSETPANIIAAQIRKQGYKCDEPGPATRDPQLSKPDLPVWIVPCEDATYRVRLVGNLADSVEKIADGKSGK